jgi:hypothetical protein
MASQWLFFFAFVQALGALATIVQTVFRRNKPQMQSIEVDRPAVQVGITGWRLWFVSICLAGSAALSAWGFVLTNRPPDIPVTKAWGAPPGSHHCNVVVNGDALLKWKAKYDVAMACGITNPERDKFEDDAITISGGYTIHPGDIAMSVIYSQPMLEAENKIIGLAHPTGIPPGETVMVAIPVNVWNEVLLVPKGIATSNLRRLSDIQRNGGYILSQGAPN